MLRQMGDTDYEKIYLYPNSHAGYYPGAKPIAMKVLFRKSDGRLLGAQALGEDKAPVKVLVIDIGGTSVKILASGQTKRRRFPSGKGMTPCMMVSGVKDLTQDCEYDVVSIGYPGPVR